MFNYYWCVSALLFQICIHLKPCISFKCYFLVQYDSCPKSYAAGIWWTRTKFGVLRIELCPPGSVGNATRICKDNVEGWLEPVLTSCTSSAFIGLNTSVSIIYILYVM